MLASRSRGQSLILADLSLTSPYGSVFLHAVLSPNRLSSLYFIVFFVIHNEMSPRESVV